MYYEDREERRQAIEDSKITLAYYNGEIGTKELYQYPFCCAYCRHFISEPNCPDCPWFKFEGMDCIEYYEKNYKKGTIGEAKGNRDYRKWHNFRKKRLAFIVEELEKEDREAK